MRFVSSTQQVVLLFLIKAPVILSGNAFSIMPSSQGCLSSALPVSVHGWSVGAQLSQPGSLSLWESELFCGHNMGRAEPLWWQLPGDTAPQVPLPRSQSHCWSLSFPSPVCLAFSPVWGEIPLWHKLARVGHRSFEHKNPNWRRQTDGSAVRRWVFFSKSALEK